MKQSLQRLWPLLTASLLSLCACAEQTLPNLYPAAPSDPAVIFRNQSACERVYTSCSRTILTNREAFNWSVGMSVDGVSGSLELTTYLDVLPFRFPIDVQLGFFRVDLFLPIDEHIIEAEVLIGEKVFISPRERISIEEDRVRTIMLSFTEALSHTPPSDHSSEDAEDVSRSDEMPNEQCDVRLEHFGERLCTNSVETLSLQVITSATCLEGAHALIFGLDQQRDHSIGVPISASGEIRLDSLRAGGYLVKVYLHSGEVESAEVRIDRCIVELIDEGESPTDEEREEFGEVEDNEAEGAFDSSAGRDRDEEIMRREMKIYDHTGSVLTVYFSQTLGLSLLTFNAPPRVMVDLTEGEVFDLSYRGADGRHYRCVSRQLCMIPEGADEIEYVLVMQRSDTLELSGGLTMMHDEGQEVRFEFNL